MRGEKFFDLFLTCGKRCVGGLDGLGEADVGFRIFVAAVDARLVGQAAQLEKRLPHHFRRALDDATAADREQCVTDESKLVGREDIADVARGVPRRLEHAALQRADPNLVVLAHGHIDQRNARGFAVRGNHSASVALLEFSDAAGVIRVMMGDENVGQPPSGRLQRGLDRCRLRRIDRRGRASFGIMQEHAVIVLETQKQAGLRGHIALRLHQPSWPIRHPEPWPCKAGEEARGAQNDGKFMLPLLHVH